VAITLKEVAREAGVSTAAVSNVLHGCSPSIRVSEGKAALIREVAQRLNYRPNGVARSLRMSRTHTVGLVFENFWNISDGPLFYLHLLDGVASPLFKSHFRLTILPEVAQGDLVGSLSDGQLEGVVWCKLADDDATLKALAECPIPIVAMSPPPRAEVRPANVQHVTCDNVGGIRLAMHHLASLGHRRIAFLSEDEEFENPDRRARLDGFRQVSMELFGRVEASDVLSWPWELDRFSSWWAGGPAATAVVCWSERAAAHLLKVANAAGVGIPEQLSVVGFDSTQYCETTKPRLTAVRQPIFEMARFASESLLAILRGDPTPLHDSTFPCELDVRDSTGPVRPQ
jgi:DNA-binding LacI/PurR family transcriptional regulator